jgi:hypothetical protein
LNPWLANADWAALSKSRAPSGSALHGLPGWRRTICLRDFFGAVIR